MPSALSVRPLAAALGVLSLAAPAHARNPPFTTDPREGVWIGAGEVFIHQTVDRFSVYRAGAAVNKLAFDGQTLWIATDDGALRFDSGSRRATRMTMSEGLPSQAVSAVAVDEQFVWLATNKGLLRWRKRDRTLRLFTESDGLPHKAVNDALTVGRQVWFATRGGLAVYDPDSDGLRSFTSADGLASDDAQELFQLGDDVWCRTDVGLSRLRPKARVFTNFSFKEIGGKELRTFVPDGDNVWVGTENGLFSFSVASDAFIPFPQQGTLFGKSVVGVELFTDYVLITTDQEVAQFHKLKRSLERWDEVKGLARHQGATGTLVAGGIYTVMFPDGAEVLDIQRELWTSKRFAVTEGEEQGGAYHLFGKLNTDEPYDFVKHQLSDQRYATALGGVGLGQHFAGGRSFDALALLDYGQLELKGIRDLQFRAEYLGSTRDAVREVRLEDKLEYRTQEEGLESKLLLQGGHARLATPGESPALSLTADAGVRRGSTVRDFLTGPRKDIYSLSKRYILPGTERVYVDGELLTSGVDYTVVYPTGQLAFLDPERVDDLSIIEVEYEVDLVAKKGLGVLSVLDLLPGDKEVGSWALSGQARQISEESGLFAQIDGAAPKYIDRGWARGVYGEFKQGSRTIQVAIHDMGSELNSEQIFDYDLPPAREAVAGRTDVVLDVGLATSYAAKAHLKTFYIELSIDEKSDAAKQSLTLFMLQILNRVNDPGSLTADAARELIVAARAAARPLAGLELGARVVELQGLSGGPAGAPLRKLRTAAVDGRYEGALGEKGRLTAYGELAGQSPGDSDGWAGMGMLRVAHPSIEGTLTGRHQSPGYTPMGSDATLFGRLRDEVRLSATGYPEPWLPSTVFFTRQLSRIEGGGSGTFQQAMARLQLTKDGLPSTSLQIGHTLLDGPTESTGRIKAVGQADYDFATGPLAFTGIKRFSVRALYGISQGETDASGSFAHADRVQLSRVEAKLAPTATESAYAHFRSRTVESALTKGGDYGILLYHWELNAGARSAIIPGLIPQFNYAEIYDDDRRLDPVRTSSGNLAATLGIYPGQWWAPLTPVVVEPRYSLAENAVAKDTLKTTLTRDHRIDNRAVYFGGGMFEVELYQLYQIEKTNQAQQLVSRRVELRNRFIYRPVYPSPIGLQLNYLGNHQINDLSLDPAAPPWGHQETYETVLEWLRRWSKTLTTRAKGSYSVGVTRDLQMIDKTTQVATLQNDRQSRVSLEGEVRLFPLADAAKLYLIQHGQVFRILSAGGSAVSQGYAVGAGGIWVVGDKLYLDGDVTFRKTICLAQPCTPTATLEPRVLLTFNL
jgi:hypothetical protein